LPGDAAAGGVPALRSAAGSAFPADRTESTIVRVYRPAGAGAVASGSSRRWRWTMK
jgi:hypothetical protein